MLAHGEVKRKKNYIDLFFSQKWLKISKIVLVLKNIAVKSEGWKMLHFFAKASGKNSIEKKLQKQIILNREIAGWH
ncbi:unnamed protein product [Blepharisma stoltei]|uniref:Uncharacterized protein n=1 Tax=Blepharisma stoltei TaxID=1481888 RepID=A0AAU9IZR0_9CILI|nr:unnamed protein product [Blepharisma stoltei]